MASFSDRLRKAIDYQRFSNRKIAEKVGVSPTSIANILADENKPNVETVTRLVEVLQINGHWLLTGEGAMFLTPGQTTEQEQGDPCETLRIQLAAANREIELLQELADSYKAQLEK